MSEDDQPDPQIEDAIQIAQRALAKVNTLEQQHDEIREEMARLEASAAALNEVLDDE